ILPWKYDEEKGIGSTDPEVQREETRDILFDPLNPQQGETVDILARVHNFSLKDHFATFSVRFYLGAPRSGGGLIGSVDIPQINARDRRVARLEDWQVPQNVSGNSKIYVVIDEENSVDEVHENNNIAWNLLNPELGMPTSVADERDGEAPRDFVLQQNYPNPFNPDTEIRFRLPVSSRVTLAIYNLGGQLVRTLASGTLPTGQHRVTWDGRDELGRQVASGIYLYRLQAAENVQVRKMTLLR
ncbi:T9SS type A sorting domain-containing protein, partial [candidate division KSB1 bacterium]|nr:T9SS type A sorting domain-containing protein [candidate division KSB1 bacterium]NIS23905.1 T9SS type A sorting domain-containing protein [candidate division KSB1 bacterium]NIT70822.1 T9SS type A sorting domain-containing protein [candidate division KSB1 bacterium]NIU24554.1 T9SS type A sorting domain-containing protein [candidate division KSB1 bacterium]NIU94508.1 T9SS type A sorting domain-containing protein [candidate division KSB1 bacterium]